MTGHCPCLIRRGLQLRFIIRGARFRPWKYESRHRKVRPLSAVRAQRLAAHNPQLSERPRAVPGLCHAARRPAGRAPRGGPPANPRVHRPPARPEAGAQLDRAEARGAAVVLQVLRARGSGVPGPGASGGHAQAAQAHPRGADRRGDQQLPRPARGHKRQWGTSQVAGRDTAAPPRRLPGRVAAAGATRSRHARATLRLWLARQRAHGPQPSRQGPARTDVAGPRQGPQGAHRALRLEGRSGAGGLLARAHRAAAQGWHARRPRGGLPELRRAPAGHALGRAHRQEIRGPCEHQLGPAPAFAAPRLCHAPARRWRRSPRHPGASRPQLPFHYAEVHPRLRPAVDGGVRQGAPPRLTSRQAQEKKTPRQILPGVSGLRGRENRASPRAEYRACGRRSRNDARCTVCSRKGAGGLAGGAASRSGRGAASVRFLHSRRSVINVGPQPPRWVESSLYGEAAAILHRAKQAGRRDLCGTHDPRPRLTPAFRRPYNGGFRIASGGFMYAVIRSGGKQYRVAPGETIKVERLAGKVGAKVTFADVLAVHNDEEKLVTGADAAKTKVTGKIVAQARYPKLTVMKYRRTKQYKIVRGHRQDYTAVEVSDIKLSGKGTSDGA